MPDMFTPTEMFSGVIGKLLSTIRKFDVEVAVTWNCRGVKSLVVTESSCFGVLVPDPIAPVNDSELGFTTNVEPVVLIVTGIVVAVNPLLAVGVTVIVPTVPEGTNDGLGTVTWNDDGVVPSVGKIAR